MRSGARDEARRRGDLPRAPGYVGLLVTAGGVAGAGLAAAYAPWGPLARAAWSFATGTAPDDVAALAGRLAAWIFAGGAAGALAGLAGAQITLGAWAPGLRRRRGGEARRPSFGLAAAALGAVALAGAATLFTLPGAGGGDPGRLLLAAAPVALAGGAALLLVPVLVERALARHRWRRRVEPEPPPRRDPEEPPPEVRSALRARAREPGVSPESRAPSSGP